MRFSKAMFAAALAAVAEARFVLYWDKWHTEQPPPEVLSKVTHITIAFAAPYRFNHDRSFQPFESVQKIKSTFGHDKKVMISIGGWGFTKGFSIGAADKTSRAAFAQSIAKMLHDTHADGVDIDWEYPGGNGADYKQIPNWKKRPEIREFPLLLAAIREAIGPHKLLSIAVPGLHRDMIAYTKETGPKIWPSVDMVNLMTYDLMNRRDNRTKHASSIEGATRTVQNYLDIGMPPEKANLGFPFYAKWFRTAKDCSNHPLGCPTLLLENAKGQDTGNSGAVTYEAHPATPVPANIAASWARAQAGALYDAEAGAEYFFDSKENIFWSWDTEYIEKEKFCEIVDPFKLGGVSAWSMGEDSAGWKHIKAISSQL